MKEAVLNEFELESRKFCINNKIRINDIRQKYFEAKPVVSFWVDNKAITSITFRSFKKGIKYSLVVNEDFTEIFTKKFGNASTPVGNKKYSNTWNTYDASLIINMVKAFV
ncbi:hypothetical protein [Aliivibrio fischeri]|uniref:hypothetical protein n=1 Tax=Aliivibrio fischeri TaxID=668 RepID=UPI003735DC59